MSTERSIITTDYFRVPAWKMIRAVAGPTLRLMWMGSAVAPLGFLIAALATHNLVWVFVAFITLMLVIPLVVLLIYFNYALRPDVAKSTIPHRLIIEHEVGVWIEYRPETDRAVPNNEFVEWRNIILLQDCASYWLLLRKSSTPLNKN